MRSIQIPVTVLKVQHKEGTGKASGKPYSFYTASVVDEDANVFGLNLSDELVKESRADEEDLEKIRNQEMVIEVEFRPKGFDCSGTIVAWE